MKEMNSMNRHTTEYTKVTCHRDGTLSFWSVMDQVWKRQAYVGPEDLASMDPEQRARALAHILTHYHRGTHR